MNSQITNAKTREWQALSRDHHQLLGAGIPPAFRLILTGGGRRGPPLPDSLE